MKSSGPAIIIDGEETQARKVDPEHGPLCDECGRIMLDVDDVLAAFELRDLLNGGGA